MSFIKITTDSIYGNYNYWLTEGIRRVSNADKDKIIKKKKPKEKKDYIFDIKDLDLKEE